MPRPTTVRAISVALFVSMTAVACSGGPPVETGISVVRPVAPSAIAPGATIRFVEGTDGRLIVGHLSKLTADSLVIQRCENCDRLRYGTPEISRLEVLRGSSRGKHFAVGLAVGALAGFVAGVINTAQPCNSTPDVCGFRDIALIAGPAEGALIGGIIGIAFPTRQKWEPVAVEHQSISKATEPMAPGLHRS
jgi:hypothetical protein